MDPVTRRTVRILIFFTAAIVTLPLLSLFAFKTLVFEGILGYRDGSVGGAVAAVVAVHLVIGAYVYTAWKEDLHTQTREEQKVK